MKTYLYEHPDHPSRVSRPEDADFAVGDPKWVRCYPVGGDEQIAAADAPVVAWISQESLRRLKTGGNASRGTVPVHARHCSLLPNEPLVRQSDHLAATAKLQAERDAAFAMSRCECSAEEACAALVKANSERDAAVAEGERLREALAEIAENGEDDKWTRVGLEYIAREALADVNQARAALTKEQHD